MKKILAILLAAVMLLGLTACGGDQSDDTMKVGFIYLHDENSTYDKNFMDAAKAACEKMGVEYVQKANIAETNDCYDAAVELVEEGCDIIFADSFGHEAHILKAAKEFKDVQFCHATGTNAHTENLDNFHNAFASIYQGRYLAGVAAGLKLNEMIANKEITAEQAKMGYVGAFTYAEVISGYTSFYLGAKSVCPTVTMDVQFTGSWYNEQLEKDAATALISKGCVHISQHADSMGAPTACESAGVPNVSYNGSTEAACPKTFIISSRINWEPYYEYMITCVKEGKAIDKDWTGTLQTGSVELSALGAKAPAAGTAEKLEAVKTGLMDGSINVFDVSTFTVGQKTLTSYKADIDSNVEGADTEVIANGIFEESKYRSAPYFDLRIDGITLVNEKY
ncbi:MAG: BMP family ABC transporter substrate-binding protein [Clostridia bacterium]|nr:BMP family ABC transporter substrate-binding protein [Clostridia bacterium]